jgi:hypothetical protein
VKHVIEIIYRRCFSMTEREFSLTIFGGRHFVGQLKMTTPHCLTFSIPRRRYSFLGPLIVVAIKQVLQKLPER